MTFDWSNHDVARFGGVNSLQATTLTPHSSVKRPLLSNFNCFSLLIYPFNNDVFTIQPTDANRAHHSPNHRHHRKRIPAR
jgi:hypothetical protein